MYEPPGAGQDLKEREGALAGYLNCALHSEVRPFWLRGGRYGLRVLETLSQRVSAYVELLVLHHRDCSCGPGHV